MDCPFCTLPPERITQENEHAVLIRDAYPVSPGHSLVIPRRHIGSWFEASEDERTAMLALLEAAKAMIDQEDRPDGYNIGINDGPAAGQTVPHPLPQSRPQAAPLHAQKALGSAHSL
jgi:diadenosine tetraphosphate (Ap4A) HIT family hydrolase